MQFRSQQTYTSIKPGSSRSFLRIQGLVSLCAVVVLVVAIIYTVYFCPVHLTTSQLLLRDGRDGGDTLTSLRGRIYDVSSDPQFRKGGALEYCAGRECLVRLVSGNAENNATWGEYLAADETRGKVALEIERGFDLQYWLVGWLDDAAPAPVLRPWWGRDARTYETYTE